MLLLSILYYLSVAIICLILTLALLISLYYKHSFTYWKRKKVFCLTPKFPGGNANINVTKFTGQTIAEIYHKLKQNGVQYGGCYIFTSAMFMPIDPAFCKTVLTKAFHNFENHGIYVDEINDKMSVNLLTLTGEKWRKMRGVLTPNFSSMKLKMMYPVMKQCSLRLEQFLEDADKMQIAFDVHDITGRFLTDVIAVCIFGLECNSLQNPETEFYTYGKMILNQSLSSILRLRISLSAPSIAKFFNINFFDPKVTNFFKELVLEAISLREKNHIIRPDILHTMMQMLNTKTELEGVAMTKELIAAQMFLYYLAGYETSSITGTYCMYELAQREDLQEKVRQELWQVLNRNAGELSYEDLIGMEYLDKVVCETMRKNPPILMIDRSCTEDFTIPETDITIDKGTKVIISTLGIHSDPEFYPNPEKFDPERFSEEEKSKRPPYTYLPFGEGPRICPGMRFGTMQVKIFIVTLLKNYKFTLHPDTKVPLETLSIGNVSNPVSKILLQVTKVDKLIKYK